jgi:predicted DNA-binding transcriptional regulator AlpA
MVERRPPNSPYAHLAAKLVAEAVIEGRQADFVEVLTRYLELSNYSSIESLKDDLLWGGEEIGKFLGVSRRWVFDAIENGRFPISRPKKGGVAARKSIILCWLLAQELKALAGRADPEEADR